MPWTTRWSHDWLASFKQWQLEDQYYREKKADLLLGRRVALFHLDNIANRNHPFHDSSQEDIDYFGKYYSDILQSVETELTQLKGYYGY
jgi:hypothetical protein